MEQANATVFTRAKIIYKGLEELNGGRLALWEDHDLGCFADDYLACDTSLNVSLVYNDDGFDDEICETFGPLQTQPLGSTAIRSTIFLNQNLESFIFHVNASFGLFPQIQLDPTSLPEFYNYLDARWRDGSPITVGGTGINPNMPTSRYAFFDLPNISDGWSMFTNDMPQGDFRSVSGFYRGGLVPGQEIIVDFADYVNYDEQGGGHSRFDDWELEVLNIKEVYQNFGEPGSCASGLQACDMDCVRPGDVNDDGHVSGEDFLLAGVLAGQNFEGPARNVVSDFWFPFEAADWLDNFADINAKFADCNGDGLLNSSDIDVVEMNFERRTPDALLEDDIAEESDEINVVLSFANTPEVIDYSELNIISKMIRINFSLEQSDASIPIHGIAFEIVLDKKITEIFGLLNQTSNFDYQFNNLIEGGDNGRTILNNDNRFSMVWTNQTGINQEVETNLMDNTTFFIAEDLTTSNPDGIEEVSIQLNNLRAINADGEFIDVGYTQDGVVTIINIPWNGISDVDEPTLAESFCSIHPNPASHFVEVDFDKPESGVIQVFSFSGQKLKDFSFANSETVPLDIQRLPNGVYSVSVFLENGRHYTQKMVKLE